MSDTGLPARRSAAFLLERVLNDGALMSALVDAGALDRLDPPDRARAQRLAQDVLRHWDRTGALLNAHMDRMPAVPVEILLRLGALELALGEAAHGVVNSYVTLASRNKHHGRLKGLVNAVLRKVAVDAPARWSGLPISRMPGWLRGPLKQAWGKKTIAGCEAAHALGAPLDLTAKTDATAVAAATGGTILPGGSVRLSTPGQVTALPGYTQGDWWVQDAAAAIPAQLATGPRVLDLCAAPGGKTLQLAAAGFAVTAVDSSENRLATLYSNLSRTGLKANVQCADAREVTGTWDTVLLDAPCSATGTIRRHPDLPFAKDGAEFAGLITLQAELIDHALTLLAPGGQLIFCTCSLLPDEGEVQIEEALTRHADLRIDSEALDQPWIEPNWRSEEGGLRLRPDFWFERGGMDGFYIAALRKAA